MNRLQYETSPYLLQHKDNPVDWYPWGEEALVKSREEDKPILLSVGYSACHWCHVMAHESFEHEPTAQMMNELFVNIKVDREERPDVDGVYMQSVHALTGRGGWPMTVFLLPNGRPFFGGTYFPRERRFGMPSFREVMTTVHHAYATRRDEIEAAANNLTDVLRHSVSGAIGGEDNALSEDLLDKAIETMSRSFDAVHGGFGAAPKFPQPMNLELLLRYHVRTRDESVLPMVTHTLKKMALGGIYDQVGGGFARYSVDAEWLVPHFEKMLYDNAQLSRLYLHAWQVTGDPFFKRIAEETYDYILREMTTPEGGFYSATDADSEGEEGKFFIWDIDELKSVLGDDGEIAITYWGATPGGNFEGKNILYRPLEDDSVAESLGISVEDLRQKIETVRETLYAARAKRVAPGLDDKILTAWNGMMLASLSEGARVLGREDYKAAALRCGDFLLGQLVEGGNRVLRTHKNGQSKINGYLEDYANLIDGLLELYQASFDERWFVAARHLADRVLDQFRAEDGGFFDTGGDHETLIVRPRTIQDNAIPSGNSMIAKQLIRLAGYTGDSRYDDAASKALALRADAMQLYPQVFGEALNAVDMLVNGVAEIAIVGDPQAEATGQLLGVVNETYRPNAVVALAPDDAGDSETVPLLNMRTMRDGKPTVYVCQNFACEMPVTTADELLALLR